jgi:endonuclease YncB( thermonuclease family)
VRRASLVNLAALLLVAAGCASSDQDPGPAAGGPAEAGVVVRVVDGDTLMARIDGSRVRVRLLGVDAPESVTPDQPVQCFGPQAGDAARRLLPEGARISLETDPTQGREDRFGRRLAVVTVEGQDTSVNERLVAGGYARIFRGDGRARLLPALRAAGRQARRSHRGLWGACPLGTY